MRWYGMMVSKASCCFALVMIALAALSWSQELDTAIFRDQPRDFTILDQISDPSERKAFQALYREQDARKKRRLATAFLEDYPASILLAQVYEVAAKASIDLDDYAAALDYGAKSIRLLPENPLLLVSLANVEIHQGLVQQATSSARSALEYLDRFDRPLQFTEQRWAELEPKLRSSCYYVLGRAAVADGMAAEEPDRAAHYQQAHELLLQSRELDPSDASAAYLLGISAISLRQSHQAAIHLADAYRSGGPLREKAGAMLKRIYQQSETGADTAFDDYVASLKGPGASAKKKRQADSAPAAPPAKYAGAESCSPCHQEVFESWEQTGMARMFRPYRKENVFGDFTGQNEFKDRDGSVLIRMGVEDERYYFEFPDERGIWRRYPVDYTIGSKWQQAYGTELPDRRIHVVPIQYSRVHNQWTNFWKVIDPPGSERADLKTFPKLTSATSYQLNCAMCHTSQLAANTRSLEATDFAYREAGINCEMCHGPAADHVATMKAGKIETVPAMAPPVRFNQISARDYVTICSQCHMQSNVVELGAGGEVNYSGEHQSFFRPIKNRPYVEFSEKAFYRDGRFRETTFIAESFVRSACFETGGAHCGHCHDPHPSDAASNPKSLRFRDQPDRMCLQCHAGYAANLELHTRHPASSEGSRCTSCHMPKIMNSLLFKAGTHRIDDIPSPEMTLRFGHDESPLACLLCHEEKTTTWAREHRAQW